MALTLADFLHFVGTVIIMAYATHQAIIVVGGLARDWMELAAGAGGVLYLLGVYLASTGSIGPAAPSLQVFGIGLLLLPRVVRVTLKALGHC